MATDKVIDGKKHASEIRAQVKKRIDEIKTRGIQPPHLAVVLVGENPASLVYIRNKQKACEEAGINFSLRKLPEAASQKEVIYTVRELNENKNVHGILVQQPLPSQICKETIVRQIAPEKDVDCLSPYNVGLVTQGNPVFFPCTPGGIISLFKREAINISGKNAVIVGRSDIVGKPLAQLLLHENATVTICHSKTQNLAEICRGADILVAAMGQPKFITANFVKEGAVVIDVGINRENGKLCGDVDYENIVNKVSYVTPVPGGVGPMTIATLMENCLKAWEIGMRG
jgi:methylenetetrahydrofolate dehydrogenase (NADP+)/methenyltetrahydrofolate cyclohydrolase